MTPIIVTGQLMAIRSHPRRVSRLGGSALVAAMFTVVVAVPATAHTELISSTPADGASTATAPREIVLEFNQPVQTQFGQIAVLDAADAHHEQGDLQIVGATVTQRVGELPAGAYRISYRVGSADGHPVTGTLTFSVTAAQTTPATAEPAVPGRQTTAPNEASDLPDGVDHDGHTTTPSAAVEAEQPGNTNALLVTSGGIAVAAVLGAVLYVMAGRRADETPDDTVAKTGQ
jgi:copper resistance protein C